MSIQVKYKNSVGNLITQQQSQNLEFFDKITLVDEKVKMIESKSKVRAGTRTTIFYYMSDIENKQEIVSKYSSVINNQDCVLSFNKQSFEEFTLWDDEEYSKEGLIRFKGKHTLDNNSGEIIFTCSIDGQTNQLLDGASKNFYINDEVIFTFNYDADGNVKSILDRKDMLGYYAALDLDQFLNEPLIQDSFFSWNDHPYFHSAFPFLPNSSKL